MLERIDYIEKNGAALVFRCYGEGSIVELPDTVRGLPVKELADHCFAREASVRYKNALIKSVSRAEWEETGEQYRKESGSVKKRFAFEDTEQREYMYGSNEKESVGPGQKEMEESAPLCGEQILEIVLPKYLEATGDYVFYGCLNLHTVHFPASMKRLGGGAFVACNKVRRLGFTVGEESETPYCLKDVLSELPFEVEVILKDEAEKTLVQLVFPEYYEESVENTPARNIDLSFHGMGYRYRQCFQGKTLDYAQYDSHFKLAVTQEFLPTILKLVFHRLKTPVHLTKARREEYLAWLQQEYKSVSRWIFEDDRMEELYLLGSLEYFTQENVEIFLKTASEKGQAEAVSYLMDYRRSHFVQEKKKKYTF